MPSGIYQRNEKHIKICRKGGLNSPTKFKKGHKVPIEWRIKFGEAKKGIKRKKLIRDKIRNSMVGNKNHFFGEHHTKEAKEKISKIHKGKKITKDLRRKLRETKIRYVEKTKFDGMPLYPTVGKYEKQILDNLENYFDYTIIRQHKVIGYFLDGYCSALNLAIEIDELYHRGNRQIKDKYKEEDIKEELNCQFLRIDIGGIK